MSLGFLGPQFATDAHLMKHSCAISIYRVANEWRDVLMSPMYFIAGASIGIHELESATLL